jgi:hypothetical protein
MFGSLINTSDRSEFWNADSKDSGFDRKKCFQFRHMDRISYISFHYFERALPYERVILMDKVTSKFSKAEIYAKFIDRLGESNRLKFSI